MKKGAKTTSSKRDMQWKRLSESSSVEETSSVYSTALQLMANGYDLSKLKVIDVRTEKQDRPSVLLGVLLSVPKKAGSL